MKFVRSSKKLVIAATTIGNILEWYEFGLYVYLAPVISTLFFPPSYSELAATINILLIFAIGFVSRPLGGLFFGYIGDRYGRRIALLSSIVLITFPTFMIGFLPTYAQVGYWAPILLCVLRLLQGFPVGGEFPGTICYLTENASSHERGYMGSFAFFGSQIGILLNIGECLFMEHFLSPEQIISWGWRSSFLIGGLIGLTGFFLRYRLKETPLFEALEKQDSIIKAPIHTTLKNFKKSILYVFFVASLPLGGFYLVFVFTTVYLEEILGLSITQGLIINGCFLLLSTILLPFFGKLGDRYGIKRILMGTAALIALLAFPFFYLAGHGLLVWTLVLEFILVILFSFHFAMISQSLPGMFPTSVRFTGLAFSYNICNMLIAGAVPVLSLSLVKHTGNTNTPAIVLIVLALFTFVSIWPLKEEHGGLHVATSHK